MSMDFAALYAEADRVGREAAEAVVPVPMVVQAVSPVDGAVLHEYPPVADGVCGFAWITVRPGNSSFARWLVGSGKARKAYGGGVQIWVSEFGQSMTRKEAYANAFARVLEANGIKAYSGSRMD